MTPERFRFLQEHQDEKLTQAELDEGWFFCCTWDFMLIQKDDPEAECCGCLKDQQGKVDRTAQEASPGTAA